MRRCAKTGARRSTARAASRASLASPRATFVEYVVKKNDTLYDIAKAHGVTTNEVCESSALGGRRAIEVGQKLRVPVDVERASYGVRARVLGDERAFRTLAATNSAAIGTTPAVKKPNARANERLAPKSLERLRGAWARASTTSRVTETLQPTKVLGVGTVGMVIVLVAAAKAKALKAAQPAKESRAPAVKKAVAASAVPAESAKVPKLQEPVSGLQMPSQNTMGAAVSVDNRSNVVKAVEKDFVVAANETNVIEANTAPASEPVRAVEVSSAPEHSIDVATTSETNVPAKPTPLVRTPPREYKSTAKFQEREYDLFDYGTAIPTFIGALILVVQRAVPKQFRIW